MDLFEYYAEKDSDRLRPLADRMRPRCLDEFVGQKHITGNGALIRHAVEEDRVFSMILWGPPGCGKTTLASIIARETRSYFIRISAVLSGVKTIKAVIEDAERQRKLYRKKTILFVDEIHRFNKAQQDAFLPHVESGLITLIGATTENPSFEVIPALLSRCRVIVLNPLSHEEIEMVLQRALTDEEKGMGKNRIVIEKDALNHLIAVSDGDVRTALNGLELAVSLVLSGKEADSGAECHRITLKNLEDSLQKKAFRYDKGGEEHYNQISALHKSLRGSDPDAAAYWLMRMISAGEDPLYIGRRMVRFASEDVGNADPNALNVALNAVEAFRLLGHPEGELALLQASVYLATAPKSNSIYRTMNRIEKVLKNTGTLPVPYPLRNAPTSLMKNLGYGKNYEYAHDYQDAFTPQSHLPEELEGQIYYSPSTRGYEKIIKERLEKWRDIREKARAEKKIQSDSERT